MVPFLWLYDMIYVAPLEWIPDVFLYMTGVLVHLMVSRSSYQLLSLPILPLSVALLILFWFIL
ncbi:hypothetical protein GYMLUDRAFT_829628 [Collybiopsis luxurians FD-317 M1]|uniref:Uncharacterized protein n=1 Tax=Collybiopsis luxurians FD-317 M1 TaxID=944289 RepID=A0A0D0C0Y8_9AGAR|nr:hypothetical protein GYMLUDRAFT_829628 [Collybiopsis luxurians FD-317 M1]